MNINRENVENKENDQRFVLENLGNKVRVAYARFVETQLEIPRNLKESLTNFYLEIDRYGRMLKLGKSVSQQEIDSCVKLAAQLIKELEIKAKPEDFAYNA